ncbi:gp53-like domain-containing protein [Escherichia coli]|uniref:Putative tail fiber protein gp53-like C-terminal domain-containing protein n=1 Tax=Escherichia coli TaxID=562 RepID=A0A7D7KHV4_ECOLX|nr:hypothetical protein [Escherichia coli]EFJ5483270.1 hypothetical protein [Escherichia coli]EFN6175979.1 hypothetical protein [Escherichia coli]EGL7780207.1 hypothetical protein [Escherichia coli]EGL7784763.1 hypothetical protein [Escherichia coli]EGL7865824.1 hypothetical protein [Escherichia coli]
MHRIDTKTAQKDKFGAGKNGFTRGNPQTGTPATDLDDDYFDMLQEELCSVVEASGASLEKGRHDQLLTALRALLLSRKNPFGDIKSDGTVKTALENLGLGEAAKRNVGTGENQIPDMSSFASLSGESGYQRLPSGRLIVWGRAMVSSSSNTITLIASFDNTNYRVIVSDTGSGCIPYGASPLSGSTFKLTRAGRSYNSDGTLQTISGPSAVNYIAIGN